MTGIPFSTFKKNKIQMQEAAEALYTEYANNKELTAFLAIDLDEFYETR